MAIPSYPSFAGFPTQFDATGRAYQVDPSSADAQNLDKIGRQIWDESHLVDPSLGGAAFGTPQWTYQFQQNGKANSISVPLPFPNMVNVLTYFPQYGPNATKEDFAPGETPFDQCAQYKTDGATALVEFNTRYANVRDTDLLPGTVITKQQGVVNLKLDYNQASKAFGCSGLPFPEVDGMTPVAADPPPVLPPPLPGNTLNGNPIDAPVPSDPPPLGAPTDDTPPLPATPTPTTTTPTGGGTPGVTTTPTPGTTGTPTTAPAKPFPWLWVALGALVLFVVARGDRS